MRLRVTRRVSLRDRTYLGRDETAKEHCVIPALDKVALRTPMAWAQGLYRLGLLGLTLALSLRALRSIWHFTIDDSGISFAYAKHLAEGLGPVAAPGAPWVEGYSNALWVFLLVPFHWLGIPLPQVSKWLGVLFFGITVALGVWLLVRDYGRRLGTAALGAAWALLLGGCLEIVVWVVAGLENALLGALLMGLAALERAERQATSRALPWSAVVAFALCITRPEGIAYVIPVLLLKGWDAWQQPNRRLELWRMLALFGVLFAVYHLVHFAVFHEWVPNTYYAKPQGRSWGKGLQYLRKSLKESGLIYLVPFAALGCLWQWRNKAVLIGYCATGVFFILYSGGDWMPHSRFVSFFAPALTLLAAHGVHNIAALAFLPLERRVPRYRVWAIEAGAFCSFLAVASLWWGYHGPRLQKAAKSAYCHFCDRTKDAQRLQKISKDAGLGRVSVLTHDFGGPSWVSSPSFYPIDFLGLCDASVARIRREQVHLPVNTLLSPYLFHEQAQVPSWIYLPKNFWRTLKDLPEYKFGYYPLSSRLLPRAPSGSYLALGKSQLIDFFPPLAPAVQPAPLTPSLGLVGVGWFHGGDGAAKVEAGAVLRVVVSVVPRAKVRQSDRLWLEVVGGRRAVRGRRVPVSRKLSGLAEQLGTDEPLRFEFEVALPKSKGTAPYKLQVSAQTGEQSTVGNVTVTELQVGAQLPPYERALPRFPGGLPVVENDTLAGFQTRVMTAGERQHMGQEWRPTPNDVALAADLRDLGDSLLEAAPRQAYVAYAWSTQLDARQWEDLVKPMLTLREPGDDAANLLELTLLREYYRSLFGPSESGGSRERQRLVAFYEHYRREAEADYFRARMGTAPSAEVGPLWVWEQRFEDPEALDWTGNLDIFGVQVPDQEQRHRWRGIEGKGMLTSRSKGERGRGTLTSPVLVLSGTKVSMLFGGGSRGEVGVELLVEGKVVRTTPSGAEVVLLPVFWDVAEFVGKEVQFRVFDRSARSSVQVDQILIWN